MDIVCTVGRKHVLPIDCYSRALAYLTATAGQQISARARARPFQMPMMMRALFIARASSRLHFRLFPYVIFIYISLINAIHSLYKDGWLFFFSTTTPTSEWARDILPSSLASNKVYWYLISSVYRGRLQRSSPNASGSDYYLLWLVCVLGQRPALIKSAGFLLLFFYWWKNKQDFL